MSRRVCLPFAYLICFVFSLSAAENPPPDAKPPAAPGEKKPAASAETKGEERKPDGKQEPAKKEEKKPAEQEKEIVVTAERLPTPREATGVSINTITEKDLQVNQENHAAEALRMVPGVVVNQTGRKGGLTDIRVRGGETDHTLVLFDGWKVNQAGRWKTFNFESLDPIGSKRIEIARGPGSALFGSEAVTGTVNLITKKGEGRPELTTSAAAGTYGRDRETLEMQGREGKFSYYAAGSRFYQRQATVNNSELDIYNYSSRFDWDFNADHALKLVVRGADLKKGWYEDTTTGMGTTLEEPDPNDLIHNFNYLVGLEYSGRVVPIWQTTLRLGEFGQSLRSTSRPPQSEWDFVTPFGVFPVSNSASRDVTRERRESLEWRNDVTVYEDKNIRNIVTLGFYGEHEFFENDYNSYDPFFSYRAHAQRHHNVYAGYVQNRLELFERAFITLVGRRESREKLGENDTGRADVSLLIPETDTRVYGSVGNAFRAPTFFELYRAQSGNPNLRPEKNFAYDVGVEQHFWKRRINLSATWFENQFTDLIAAETGFPWRNYNVSQAVTRGFELGANVRPVKQVELNASATLMSTKDDQGRRLLRRPARTYTARLVAHPLVDLVPAKHDGLDLSLEFLSVSVRTDLTVLPGTFTYVNNVRNPGYHRADLAVSYRFLEHFRAFARFENLTDEKYQEVLTFPADGANALAGLEFKWRF
jgi:vitamin B12 transporter